MNTTKIIIALTIIVAILGVLFVLLMSDRSDQVAPPTIEEAIKTMPTGITKPTTAVPPGSLDVVSISPSDSATAVTLDTVVEVTFSRPFALEEIEFFMEPETPYLTNVFENTLIIAPQSGWDEGTLYTYSIVFPDDPQKVRLYRFTTTGELQEFLPDTRPDDLIAEEEQYARENEPDVYLTNQTPYENTIFAINAAFEPTEPAHFYFTVYSKVTDQQQVQNSVNTWLQSLGLTADQISALDIRYQ